MYGTARDSGRGFARVRFFRRRRPQQVRGSSSFVDPRILTSNLAPNGAAAIRRPGCQRSVPLLRLGARRTPPHTARAGERPGAPPARLPPPSQPPPLPLPPKVRPPHVFFVMLTLLDEDGNGVGSYRFDMRELSAPAADNAPAANRY